MKYIYERTALELTRVLGSFGIRLNPTIEPSRVFPILLTELINSYTLALLAYIYVKYDFSRILFEGKVY